IEGRAVGLRASDVTHGSLVGRVLRSYCRAPIISVPVEDIGGGVSREAYLDGLRSAERYAHEHPGMSVLINVSLASDRPDPLEEGLIRRLLDSGALVVAAVGNDDSDEPMYPAAYPGVIAVASATGAGKAPTSNFGRHVSIAASGDITFIDYEFLPYTWLRHQMDARGTSFAAPRVTATLAYLLEADSSLSPQGAYEIVEATARTLDDDRSRRGLLGAGLLDVHRAKSAVRPSYRFVHFVLPVCVWVVLGVFSGYLCLRYGSVGLFLTLMIWSLGLPTSVLLIIKLGGYLEFVGGGSLVVGLGVTGIFGAALAMAALIQQWQVAKAVAALALPFAVFLVLSYAGLTALGWRMSAALGAAVLAVLIAVVQEAMARRMLGAVAARARSANGLPSEWLIRVCRRTLDRRIKLAVIDALARKADEGAVAFLLQECRPRRPALAALTRVARDDVDALAPWIRRLSTLEAGERDSLLAALRQARNPAAIAHLAGVAEHDRSSRIRELIEILQGEGRSSPDDGCDTLRSDAPAT
ncbi:MAG: S8 family peptidase, partial [Planctomycetota bacterium]